MVFFLMSTLELVDIILFWNICYLVQSSNLRLQNCLVLLSYTPFLNISHVNGRFVKMYCVIFMWLNILVIMRSSKLVYLFSD
jgi:hypothetical protein